MSSIPSVADLGQARFSGRTGVTSIDTSQVGTGTQALANTIDDVNRSRSKYQLSKAQSAFLKLKAEQDGGLDSDKDYETMTDRYNKTMTEGLAKIAATVGDGQLREEFIARNEVDVTRGVENARDVAWGKEKDFERAEIQGNLDNLREVALNGDIESANLAMGDLLNSASERGYLNEQERQKMQTGFRESVAVGRLKMMEPEDRIAALKEPWAQNIPSDTRAQLQREAKVHQREAVAVSTVDGYRGLTEAEVLERTSKIRDPKLRKIVEQRADYMLAKQKRIEIEQSSDIVDKYMTMHLDGDQEFRYGDIPEDELDVLNAQQQQQLYNLQFGSTKKVSFNAVHQDELNRLKALGERGDPKAWVELRKYFTENVAELSNEQQKSWSQVSIDGVIPKDVDDGLTDIQRVTNYLGAAQISDAGTKSDLILDVGKYRRDSDKPLSDEDIDRFIKAKLKERVYSKGTIWDSESRLIEMDDDQKEQLRTVYVQDYPTDMRLASDFLSSSKGIDMTTTDQVMYVDAVQDLRSMYGTDVIDDVISAYQIGGRYRPVSVAEIESQARMLLRSRTDATN